MRGDTWLAWTAFAACAACCTTPPPPVTEPPPPSPPTCEFDGGTGCASANDCPDPLRYVCDSASNCCVVYCRAGADCVALGEPCAQSFLGCACHAGSCLAKACSADTDCAASGVVCKEGACVPPDPPTSPASCRIRPGPFALHAGTSQRLHVALFDDAGKPLRLAPGSLQWWSTGNSISVDGGSLSSTTPSNAFGDSSLWTWTGAATCSAYVTVYGGVADGGNRLVVLDQNTNLPISDATLGWSDGRNGGWLGEAADGGDALGQYALGQPPDLDGGLLLVNVLHEHYGYVSIVVPAGGLPPDAIVLLPQDPPFVPDAGNVVGGITGDFTQEPGALDPAAGMPANEVGEVHAAFAGSALPLDPLPHSLVRLFGPTRPVEVRIGSAFELQIPRGAAFGFGVTWYACTYEALAPAGSTGRIELAPEADPGAAGWLGSSFARSDLPAWALGGSVPFNVIGPLPGHYADGSLDFVTTILETLSSADLRSAVAYEAPAVLLPPLLGDAGTDGCGAPLGATPPQPAALANVPLGPTVPTELAASVLIPELPGANADCQQGALIIGGAIEPGTGLLPLGMSGGFDGLSGLGADIYPCTVAPPGAADVGEVALQVAPAHGGLEGDRYAIEVLSENAEPPSSKPATARSGLVATMDALPEGTTVDLGDGGFLPYVSSAGYDWTERVVSWNPADAAGASWLELRFVDDEQRGWRVVFPPDAPSFYLPVPPAPFEDRTFGASLAPSAAEFDAIALTAGGTLADDLDFTRADGPLALDLLEQVRAWNGLTLPGN